VFGYFYYGKTFKYLIVPGTIRQVVTPSVIAGLNKLGLIASTYSLDISKESSVFVNGTVHDYEKAFKA
jgi:hypothetical protein